MKLKQLLYVVEIVRNNNHLTAAADALNASQPGVSRQVQQLEAELGFDVFARTRNRIIGLTEPGHQVYEIATRISTEMIALKALKEDVNSGNRGSMIIGTTHTMARYMLPRVIGDFVKKFPDVRIVLKQGHPEYACELVDSGNADLAITTETARTFPNLAKLNAGTLDRCVIAKAGHPLLELETLTIEEIAKYPIITYDQHYSGYRKVMNAFKVAGLEPKTVLSAIDADVCKTYVEMDLGVAILSKVSFEDERDFGLRRRDASHLFESSTISISLRKNSYLRPFLFGFVQSFATNITRQEIRDALNTSTYR